MNEYEKARRLPIAFSFLINRFSDVACLKHSVESCLTGSHTFYFQSVSQGWCLGGESCEKQ